MIKNIIFDLGNVIINYNQKKIINNFTEKEEEIKYIYDEIFHAPEWTLMDLGDITNDEAIEIINKRNEFKYEKLTQEFLHEWHKKFHSFLASLKGTHRNESLELEAFSLYNISQGNIYYKARGGELQTSVTHRLNQYKKQCKCSFFKHT